MFALSDVDATVDDLYLERAAALARRGLGRTAPNPAVGAVIVHDGRVVGEGFHPRAGEPHAEVFALAAAGGQARGATAYVTLEPCAHHGKTPPCADALVAAGVARVVIGMPDPTSLAAGGADRLRAAGVAVDFAPDPEPFERLVSGWLHRERTGRPYLRAKIALTLDGRASFASGERASITGLSGAAVTRTLRERVDAVLVGAATVIADDPALTVRGPEGTLAEHQPTRIVLVRGTMPSTASRIFTDGAAPTLALVPSTMDAARLDGLPSGVVVQRYEADRGLLGAVEALGARGLSDVLIEPGPTLLSALWTSGLLDEIVTVVAGGMAGADAPALHAGRADREADALVPKFTAVEARAVDGLAVTTWRPSPLPPGSQTQPTP